MNSLYIFIFVFFMSMMAHAQTNAPATFAPATKALAHINQPDVVFQIMVAAIVGYIFTR
jgi:hypothetical protein